MAFINQYNILTQSMATLHRIDFFPYFCPAQTVNYNMTCVFCPQPREPQQTSCLRRRRALKTDLTCAQCHLWSRPHHRKNVALLVCKKLCSELHLNLHPVCSRCYSSRQSKPSSRSLHLFNFAVWMAVRWMFPRPDTLHEPNKNQPAVALLWFF